MHIWVVYKMTIHATDYNSCLFVRLTPHFSKYGKSGTLTVGSVLGIVTIKLGGGKGGIYPQSHSRFVLEMTDAVPISILQT